MFHLNRVKARAYWVKENELTDEQATKVFDDLPPCSHDTEGNPRYEEGVVDRKIERVRHEERVGKAEADTIHGSIVRETLIELMKGVAQCRGMATGDHCTKSPARHREVVGTRELANAWNLSQAHIRRLKKKMPARCKAKKNGRCHGFYKAEADAWLRDYKAS